MYLNFEMPLPQALAERLKKRGSLLEDHSKTDKQENGLFIISYLCHFNTVSF